MNHVKTVKRPLTFRIYQLNIKHWQCQQTNLQLPNIQAKCENEIRNTTIQFKSVKANTMPTTDSHFVFMTLCHALSVLNIEHGIWNKKFSMFFF